MEETPTADNHPEWRYVIYARKSTEDAEKQVRSIDDQVADCEKMANELGLNVVDTIRETKSAKIPGKRPLFAGLIKDIREGRVDGIIAWHPDRIARNMVEAGRIIHMLDTNTIKDLRFKSHQFSNDANGKMLLGMLFVFAKHYSDDLSAKVNRGVQGNFAEGKSGGTPKYGYIRDDEGIYRTDGKNFTLMQNAWLMRADGETEEKCAEYLTTNGFAKLVKREKSHVVRKISNTSLSVVFRDTFYFGLLNQAGQAIDLRQAPIPFTPMIDEETFYKVQELTKRWTRGASKAHPVFLPLRHLVFCGVCNSTKPMTVARSKSRLGDRFLYYSCKNKDCPRKPKALRGKEVMNSLADIIEAKIATLPASAYKTYVEEVKAASGVQKVKVREELSRMQAVLTGYRRKQSDRSVALGKLTSPQAITALNQEINVIANDIVQLEADITKHKRALARTELPMFSPADFELRIKRTAARFKKADKFQKDAIIREMFLKLVLDNEKVASYHWKEPFLSLVETTDIQLGGLDWIFLEPNLRTTYRLA